MNRARSPKKSRIRQRTSAKTPTRRLLPAPTESIKKPLISALLSAGAYLAVSCFLLAPLLTSKETLGAWMDWLTIMMTCAVVGAVSYLVAVRRLSPAQSLSVIAAVCVVAFVGMNISIGLGLGGIVDSSRAMYLATYTWFFAVAVVTAIVLPHLPQTPANSKIAITVFCGVLITTTPFISDGMESSASPRGVMVSAISECGPGVLPAVSSLQYVFTTEETEPSPEEWKQARVIGFQNGQALEKFYWPPMLPENQWMHRRYLVRGVDRGGSAAQRIREEHVNALVSAVSLGRDRPIDWTGTMVAPCLSEDTAHYAEHDDIKYSVEQP